MIYLVEENCEHSIPSNFLSNLTETLLATFNNGSFSEHQINQALDRYVPPSPLHLQSWRGGTDFPQTSYLALQKPLFYTTKIGLANFVKSLSIRYS